MESDLMDTAATAEHGWATDPKALANLFKACHLNYKLYDAERVPDTTKNKIYGIYKQATVGDCDEAKPYEPSARRKWNAWMMYQGTDQLTAKRRYITLLKELDPILAKVTLVEEPPHSFPTTKEGWPICARSNCAGGCHRPLIDEEGIPITEVLEDESMLEYEPLLAFVKNMNAHLRCQWGFHVPISASQARPFGDWFDHVGNDGFKAFNVRKDSPLPLHVAALVEKQIDKYVHMQENEPEFTYEDRLDQYRRVLTTLRVYKEVFNLSHVYNVPCTRQTEQCIRRRRCAGGKNHTHPFELIAPRVDYGVYDQVALLRKEVVRLGLSPYTSNTEGVETTKDRQAELEARLADHHRLKFVVAEAKRRQRERRWWMPQEQAKMRSWETDNSRKLLIKAILEDKRGHMVTLIRRGCPDDTETPGGMTAVIRATLAGDKLCLRKLVDAGADVNVFNKKHGMSALCFAARRDDLMMMHELLELGAYASLEGPTGHFPLECAAAYGHVEPGNVLVDYAVRNGISGSLEGERVMQYSNKLGETALHSAARNNHLAAAAALLKGGVDRDKRNDNGLTAAGEARQAGWAELADWLESTQAVGRNAVDSYSDKQLARHARLASGKLSAALESGALASSAANTAQANNTPVVRGKLGARKAQRKRPEKTHTATPATAAGAANGPLQALSVESAGQWVALVTGEQEEEGSVAGTSMFSGMAGSSLGSPAVATGGLLPPAPGAAGKPRNSGGSRSGSRGGSGASPSDVVDHFKHQASARLSSGGSTSELWDVLGAAAGAGGSSTTVHSFNSSVSMSDSTVEVQASAVAAQASAAVVETVQLLDRAELSEKRVKQLRVLWADDSPTVRTSVEAARQAHETAAAAGAQLDKAMASVDVATAAHLVDPGTMTALQHSVLASMALKMTDPIITPELAAAAGQDPTEGSDGGDAKPPYGSGWGEWLVAHPPTVEAVLPVAVELIKNGGVNPDLETASGTTALIAAAFAGHAAAIRVLRMNGAKYDYANRNGRTALMAAAAGGHCLAAIELLRWIIDSTIKDLEALARPRQKSRNAPRRPQSRNAPADKRTAVMEAVAKAVDTIDLEGKSALAYSDQAGHNHMSQLLVLSKTVGLDAAVASYKPDPQEDVTREAMFVYAGATPGKVEDATGPELQSHAWRLPLARDAPDPRAPKPREPKPAEAPPSSFPVSLATPSLDSGSTLIETVRSSVDPVPHGLLGSRATTPVRSTALATAAVGHTPSATPTTSALPTPTGSLNEGSAPTVDEDSTGESEPVKATALPTEASTASDLWLGGESKSPTTAAATTTTADHGHKDHGRVLRKPWPPPSDCASSVDSARLYDEDGVRHLIPPADMRAYKDRAWIRRKEELERLAAAGEVQGEMQSHVSDLTARLTGRPATHARKRLPGSAADIADALVPLDAKNDLAVEVDGTLPLQRRRKQFHEMSEDEQRVYILKQSLRRAPRRVDATPTPPEPEPLHQSETFNTMTNVAELQRGAKDQGAPSSLLVDLAVQVARTNEKCATDTRTKTRMETLGQLAGGNGTTGGTRKARQKANEMLHEGLDEWKDRLQAVRDRWVADYKAQRADARRARMGWAKSAEQEAADRNPPMYIRPAEVDYATWLLGQRRYQQAESLLDGVLVTQQSAGNLMGVGWTYRTMAAVQEAKGHLSRALKLREDSLALMAQVVDPTSREIMEGLDLVSGTLIKLGLWGDAATIYRAAAKELSGAHTDQRQRVYFALKKRAEDVERLRERQQLQAADEEGHKVRQASKNDDPWREWYEAHGQTKEHLEVLLTENHYISSRGRKAFKTFVQQEGNHVEILAFWLAARDLKRMGVSDGGYAHACRRLYKQYVRPTAKLPMLTQGIRNELAAVMEAAASSVPPKEDMFDQAQALAFEAIYSQSFVFWIETEDGVRWHRYRLVCVQEPRKLAALISFQRHVRAIVPKLVEKRLAEEKAAKEAELRRKAKEMADAMEAHARAVELYKEQQREAAELECMRAEEAAQRALMPDPEEEHHTPRPGVTFAFDDDLREVLD